MKYYSHRYIARITVEAETPLSVGSGEKGINTDRLVAKDTNGLPYIPGTSLAGVLRHSFKDQNFVDKIFGSGGNNGEGSRLIVSSAHLVGSDGKTVIEGLQKLNLEQGYYSYFSRLPERDHVRMTDKGAADTENHGKYDEELVHKGTRFVFELELIGEESDGENWKSLLEALASPIFRIGAGTRKGFGKLKIVHENSWQKTLDLKKEIKAYLDKSSSLNSIVPGAKPLSIKSDSEIEGWTNYSLHLKAKDFFLFSAGFGDDDADNKPKTEKYFDWSSGKPELTKEEFLLIPATSIKGIIAHRTAYHFNSLENVRVGKAKATSLETVLDVDKALAEMDSIVDMGNLSDLKSTNWEKLKEKIQSIGIDDLRTWSDYEQELKEETMQQEGDSLPVGENNEAVKTLFGFAKDSDKEKDGLRGSVIINDFYLPINKAKSKVLSHTKIDRFTGGTIDGALFQEKVAKYEGEISIEIWVNNQALQNGNIKKAFEATLDDIRNGRLQLGGNSTKGHGVFKGI